jgi:hypothetical protein
MITGAYRFTDYRSQGQMLLYVIVNIATPLSGDLSLYVALSQSSGWSTIILLQDFDPKISMQTHSTVLLAEDNRFEEMDKITKEWGKKDG